MKKNDSRRAQRIAATLPMKLSCSDGKSFEITTWDFSDNGVFLEVEDAVRHHLSVNAKVNLQFQNTNFEPPIVSATVVRMTNSGIALELKETIKDGHAQED